MASASYMAGRKKYARPQAMLWSDTAPTLINGSLIPAGYDRMSNRNNLTEAQLDDSFLILSDHNRAEISITPQRIEQRRRMINSTMRSYHNADKLTIATSWNMLPSRSFSDAANFDQNTGLSVLSNSTDQYTSDGGAGGVAMLDWYETHTGPFWVLLSYDKYKNFSNDQYHNLAKYSQAVQMYLTSFTYTIVKRGGSNYDMWNISINLEEV